MTEGPLSASAYEILGVSADVSEAQLRRAYRMRLRETHPDTGGDAAAFLAVQRAWELVGDARARAAYDRGQPVVPETTFAPDPPPTRPARPDTRPRARTSGHPGGHRRERYLQLIREWAGRGAEPEDPYDPVLVRSAPREIRRLLAEAIAEETSARTIADLGMGYTAWHAALAPRSRTDRGPIDHVVLGPSGLYAIDSLDPGAPVRVRRSELVGDTLDTTPAADLVARARALGRAAGVRFSGAILVLPDEDAPATVSELGRIRGLPVVAVTRSGLAALLRRGIPGAPDMGGNELFDVRTRLQRVVVLG